MESYDAARAIRDCLRSGAREFVICGGARNAEIVAGLCGLGRRVRRWGFPEERSAAFFALGRSRASGLPVAVVTTSGTAVAELLPAAVEAHYSRVPLVLLTADRPESFRGSGAPQAIEQLGLFGPYAATDVAGWCGRRPLHLNVGLEEPDAARISGLARDLAVEWGGDGNPAGEPLPDPAATESVAAFVGDGRGLTVMLGGLPRGWRAPVAAFLKRLGAPVWAEATSGLREAGLQPLTGGGDAARVLRIGEVPSCRAWRDLESRAIPVLSVPTNGLPGLARRSKVVGRVDWDALLIDRPQGPPPAEQHPEQADSAEARWVNELSEAIPEGALVFLGNSLPIREWNRFATYRERGLRCFANRGANGIDGLVATFLGLAEGEDEAWCLLGDLSALYDLAAPWVMRQMSAGNRRIVVLNNGGGKIFRGLGALEGADADTLAMMENPHALRFGGWAKLFDMAYVRAEHRDDLRSLPAGDVMVEIVTAG